MKAEKFIKWSYGIPFSIHTMELSGSTSIILGRKRNKQTISGTFEVWSRGVPYELRGKSSVSL